ncbi:MAG TPA: hypothetical protein VFU43_02865 [Streptosporangiaceae bacterium]|nr:hypothetical protein [Streptosporangiaceae bacterium]
MAFKLRRDHTATGQEPTGEAAEGDWAWPLAFTDRACCCPAKPVVVAVMPPTPARPYPMDLLLCGHHYALARESLAAGNAIVYDKTGARLTPADAEQEAVPADAASRT